MTNAEKPLAGQVALVAGATRGAGRGIALELAAAGAKVYCTGRSVRGAPSPMGRPETIEETAERIVEAGGAGLAIRVDHTVEAEVQALAERIRAEDGRLDVLVNDVWGGDSLIDWQAKFWDLDIGAVRALIDQAVVSHLITAKAVAPIMIEAKRGLIVEVTDGELAGYRGQVLQDLVKSSVVRLAYAMAWDLSQTGVTALAISPGFLRSEAMLQTFGVTEANWREGAKRDPAFRLFRDAALYRPRHFRPGGRPGREPKVRPVAGDQRPRRRIRLHRSRRLATQLLGPYRSLARPAGRRRRAAERPGLLDGRRGATALIHAYRRLRDRAKAYAGKLGFDKLGAGLRPRDD